ncbi:DUF397 domain-containing protein [Streptomyces sp. NPDC002055]|uniref:DUF397 domain-containing protein n=1 Tax=Streptomyces sp. NPDC002055 TaxID=3154534 RepID=UPI003327478D
MTQGIAATHGTSHAVWRKSSFSGGNNECVEVAIGVQGTVPVRDSKNPDGAVLTFTEAAWKAFVTGVSAGEFERTSQPIAD